MKRKHALIVVAGLMLPLGTAANAGAQGATLVVTPSSATPGQVVTVTGSAFNPSTANIASGVNIRLSTRDSEPLANSNVSPQGTISATFPLPPNLTPGVYLLIGTQTSTRDRHTFGGPGRAKLRITAAGAAAIPGHAPGDPAAPPGVLIGTFLALLGLTCGLAVCGRRLWAARRPAGHDPLPSR
jgi:hypothetical protein